MATKPLTIGLLVLSTALVGLTAAPTASAHVCIDEFGEPPECNGHVCPQGQEPHMHVETDENSHCTNLPESAATSASFVSWLFRVWSLSI